ncbi:ATP-binding protein [Paraburkholderia mimosarum]|uniref:ATP-binding protein n=1 Tax=Paraburkholderia mimosarum TaxID=312026 RepID=UPI0004800DC8|nr:ATP-binding protein [Paraburkholderia mimosarum]
MTTIDRNACRALILAPLGRDAPVAAALLREAGTGTIVCADIEHFSASLSDEISCAVVTEEALRDADLTDVAVWVATQPKWSDFPFIILTQRGGYPDRNPQPQTLVRTLGNVVFLERPFHPMTFVSVVATAQRGRYRQYEARARMEELHESEARLRTALTAGQLGQWELDLPPTEFTASAPTRAVFGWPASGPFTYGDFEARLHPDDRERAREAIRISIETRRDFAVECRCFWSDGTLRWVDLRARHVFDRRSRKARLVGVSSDITSRKTAEANLRRLNETLEAKVLERTAQLERAHRTVLEEIQQREHTEEVLRQVQKMEMIGQLTGGVAHDFNNLLMAVMGNLELLRKQIHDEKLARLVDGALRGASRGASLTQRLLAFARQQDLRIEPTHLGNLIRGMTDLLERSVGARIELEFELPAQLPLTLADANQVELALLNLVVNARDAMPDGGTVSIRVDEAQASGHPDLAAGDYVRVIVSDTGHGMNATTLSKAMEPFFTTKELGKGTGLGLSMAHGLALQLNGALRLESEEGRGTRVELWLPVTAQVPVGQAVAESMSNEGSAAPKGVTILLVDDDALICNSTAYLLEDLGHEVIEANSGASALEVLKNGRKVDLLITDYSMPGMTGIQLAYAARQLRPDLPVVMATGYADLPSGTSMDIVRLRKPYQQHQLVAEIAKALRLVRSG